MVLKLHIKRIVQITKIQVQMSAENKVITKLLLNNNPNHISFENSLFQLDATVRSTVIRLLAPHFILQRRFESHNSYRPKRESRIKFSYSDSVLVRF